MSKLRIISAGAGSGKTYRLTEEMVKLLQEDVRASGIIATTFTKKAAAELQERVRVKLLEEGLTSEADDLTNALIGTVHGLGVKLLRRFAFEAGLSPVVDIVADEDQQLMFNQSLSTVLTQERIRNMEYYSDRLGLNKRGRYDWRREVKNLTDLARSNDFSISDLQESKKRSFQTFVEFLGEPSAKDPADFNKELLTLLQSTLAELQQNGDNTKKTREACQVLKSAQNKLQLHGTLDWHQWVKIGKTEVAVKSKDAMEPLREMAWQHEKHPEFRKDIRQFIEGIFDIAIEALHEYELYKNRRGLIDYIDMELQVKRLLDHPQVRQVLEAELDLLMVDEFQDTNPIQLEIFLKLAEMAKYAVWVGDPKQSIYGFRGAEPQLMQEIIRQNNGIKTEDIQVYSWRSREEIVYATNALFTKAFPDLPPAQVILKPKRTKIATPDSQNQENEPLAVNEAIHHWHFTYDGEGRRLPARPWMENCIADSIGKLLDRRLLVFPKEEKAWRPVQPGDIAVLCRSNTECQAMAKALHRAGLRAAISRSGLLNTAELKLILACMKFILNESDSLCIAEILLLADAKNIEDIIDDRLLFLEEVDDRHAALQWARDNRYIARLHELREKVTELSTTEILNLLLLELDLYRVIAAWGSLNQRMGNIDVLRQLALQYEEACNRLHTAASLGGFLLWLYDLESKEEDHQASGEGPDAVNVLTYHRSKGLEWPVVICHSLENNLRDNIWGVNIISDSEEVDLKNVLAGRWLRYWINPYADQLQKTPLAERINASPVRQAAREQALQEEARLLYVGITRARDYLIFPTRPRPTKWLNRVWHQGEEDIPTLDTHSPESPWEWESSILYKKTEEQTYPKDFPQAEPAGEEILFFEPPHGPEFHLPYLIDLHKETFGGEITGKVVSPLVYGSPLPRAEDADQYQVAKLTKAFLTADHLDYPEADRQAMAKAFLQRYELEEVLETEDLLALGRNFFEFLIRQFNTYRIHRKYPIRMHREGRLFKTIIDIILETDKGLILIQNTSFGGERKKWRGKAQELIEWMHLSKLALQEVFKVSQVRTFVHFVMGSALVECRTQGQKPGQQLRISDMIKGKV